MAGRRVRSAGLPGVRNSHTVRDSLNPCTGSVCVLEGCRWQGSQAIERGGGAEWQQRRVKGSTPRRQLRPAQVVSANSRLLWQRSRSPGPREP